MNKLIKNKNQLTIIMVFLIISLFFLSTIAYSAFSSTMHITGTARAYDDTYIWRLFSGGTLLTRVYSLASSQGVRLVITISKNIIG